MANYCRRQVSVCKPDNTWVYKPCYEKINTPNALEWCDGCRKRLPFWPSAEDMSAAVKGARP